MSYLVQFSKILKDDIAFKLFMIVATISLISCAYSFYLGIFFILLVVASVCASFYFKSSLHSQNQLQDYLSSHFEQSKKIQLKDPERILIARGLDKQIESFFVNVLDTFINTWYLDVTHDVSFTSSLKVELAGALRKIAMRYRKVDYANVLTTKLLPIVYNHLSEIEQNNEVQKFIENGHSIHPATLNRRAEIQYLRSLSESIIPLLCTSSNLKCRPVFNLVRELLSNSLLLPLTDLISDPSTINMLVVLATNPKTNVIPQFNGENCRKVELLENFFKTDKNTSKVSQIDDSEDFFKDQEKLYNFMHFLRNKSFADVEILKFVLDVDHLNIELAKSHTHPSKLSELQCRSEELLKNYQENLFKGSEDEKPKDLQTAYQKAKTILEHKWKFDFYKSADYYKLTYGEREVFNTSKPEKDQEPIDPITSQKLSTKIRNAMAMKVVADGIEEDIQVWDALDASISSPSYYNSMAVKLRKERGQDLENFMQTFYHSIEQEADIGEDISAQMQMKKVNRQKNFNELYQNLFNIPFVEQQSSSSFVKTPTQSFLYFLAKIVKIPNVLLRIVTGVTQLLPDSDSLVLMSIRKLANRLINQAILAYLVKELKVKLFDTKSVKVSQAELEERKALAIERLEKLRTGLSESLKHLQDPIFNKHLVYSLLDVVVIEGFPELNPHT